MISFMMNQTFVTEEFTPSNCRQRWKQTTNPEINKSPLTIDEAKQLMLEVGQRIQNSGPIWCDMEKVFENRPAKMLFNCFNRIFKFILKRMNIFFGDPQNQKLCRREQILILDFWRINSMLSVTLLLIIFFSKLEQSQFEQNGHFFLIVGASKKVMPFIEYFINIGVIYQEDVKFYFDRRPFRNLEKLTHDEFANIFEPLLLLDTLNRIALASIPYNYGIDNFAHKFAKYKKLQKFLQSEKIDESYLDENYEILQPKIYAFNKGYAGFVILSKSEVQIIQKSEIIQAMLPFQEFMLNRYWQNY